MGIKHDVTVELFYSGVWNDHTATDEVFNGDADHGQDIKITIGGTAESGGITPATANLTFNSWRFNPDNVTSDLYGLIDRNTPIRITVDDAVRFVGEVAAWEPRQTLGGDVQVPVRWVQVEAGGELRRIESGTDPLPSSLRTFYTDHATQPAAYWPLDSGDLSDLALPVVGAASFDRIDGNARFSGADIAGWLEPGVSVGDGSVQCFIAGDVTMTSQTPTTIAGDHMRRNAGDARGLDFYLVGNGESGSGERYDWVLDFNPTTTQVRFFQLKVTDSQASTLHDTITSAAAFDDKPHHWRLQLTQDGSDIDWVISMDGESMSTGTVTGETLQGVSSARLIAPSDSSASAPGASHIAVFEGAPPALADTVEAAFGYAGEAAGARFLRVSSESGITATLLGTSADTVHMGPQFRGTLAAQYEDIQNTDGGLIFDTVDDDGVTYKTGRDLWNQDAALTLDYAAFEVAPPLKPILDDKLIRNDVTAERPFGASFRAVDETSVAAVGRYSSKPPVNVFSDLVLGDAAGWWLHVGTTSGTRFAQVTVDLDACPGLVDDVVSTRVGDRIVINNLPAELTPDAASLIVNGWSELAAADRRKVTFNCVPEAPYHVAELEHDEYATVGALDTTVSGDHTATATTLDIDCGADGLWVHESDFDIVIAGERMTVTAVSAGSGTFPNQSQSLTVTRSVNGVVKAQVNGAAVQLFNRAYIGLLHGFKRWIPAGRRPYPRRAHRHEPEHV